MSHALIIDDNLIFSRAVRSRLEAFGFNSFDHAWAEQQALEAAAERRPDLIVVGDTIVEGSPRGVADMLACNSGAPVLVVTTRSFMLQRQPCNGAQFGGPHLLVDLDDALARIKQRPASAFAHGAA